MARLHNGGASRRLERKVLLKKGQALAGEVAEVAKVYANPIVPNPIAQGELKHNSGSAALLHGSGFAQKNNSQIFSVQAPAQQGAKIKNYLTYSVFLQRS